MSSATMISYAPAPVRHRPCPDCVRSLGHCHGTLIVHVHGELECTDADCTEMDFALHELVLECAQLSGGCGCDGDH